MSSKKDKQPINSNFRNCGYLLLEICRLSGLFLDPEMAQSALQHIHTPPPVFSFVSTSSAVFLN
jgi:hypothetical protein